MDTPSILISGAGIGGPVAASRLAAAGWNATVIERVEHLRDDGQNVDVRGTGREVLRRMGLDDAVRAHHTSETGQAFLDADGGVYASFPAGAEDADTSPTADLEILRGQLARLLYDHSSAAAQYVFGDRITALHDDGHGVDVEFAHGAARRFDAVVIAEGSRSRTRELAFGESGLRELGLVFAYATIPRTSHDDRRWRIHAPGGGRLVHLRPDNVGTTRAMLTLRTDVRGLDRLDHDDVRAVLRATFADVGWQTPRILAALEHAPLYLDQVAQIHLPTWHRGRIALLGDSAWSAGPFGTGTTNALTGAYVLAGELGRTPGDIAAAFTRYETVLRPQTDRAQSFVMPRIAHPRSKWQRRLLHGGLRALAGPLGNALNRVRTTAPPVDTITLPDYPSRTATRR
ncbi:FAD-dependent monooxygenase [Pseudonocardia sp. HH130630-07]|uniref:FAD-dependent monooxygenase n=1 Tax=Pseudonocardia sp. HH130630-07 TaxID=1690815 RepID=UPI000814E65B|nr:FAD-dependent monooxygenase [Pseudonocardia sp. HH130630-07]ANY09464.1 hypothetical protein AFB00_28105 [Pseudonocardia sp. HH130630-07]